MWATRWDVAKYPNVIDDKSRHTRKSQVGVIPGENFEGCGYTRKMREVPRPRRAIRTLESTKDRSLWPRHVSDAYRQADAGLSHTKRRRRRFQQWGWRGNSEAPVGLGTPGHSMFIHHLLLCVSPGRISFGTGLLFVLFWHLHLGRGRTGLKSHIIIHFHSKSNIIVRRCALVVFVITPGFYG